ncbi:MAG: PAS domain-containing protein [Pseudomonadota bacterium]
MDLPDWAESLPAALTVCDASGRILAMNAKADATFGAGGGRSLVGADLMDCHPEPAARLLGELLAEGRANVYTVEKNGRKKLIAQLPWTRDGVFAGLVELSIELPEPMAHKVRKPA